MSVEEDPAPYRSSLIPLLSSSRFDADALSDEEKHYSDEDILRGSIDVDLDFDFAMSQPEPSPSLKPAPKRRRSLVSKRSRVQPTPSPSPSRDPTLPEFFTPTPPSRSRSQSVPRGPLSKRRTNHPQSLSQSPPRSQASGSDSSMDCLPPPIIPSIPTPPDPTIFSPRHRNDTSRPARSTPGRNNPQGHYLGGLQLFQGSSGTE